MSTKEIAYLNCIGMIDQCIEVPVAIFDPKGRLAGCTHPERGLSAQQIFRLCLNAPESPESVAKLYNVEYTTMTNPRGELQCYLLLMDAFNRKDLLRRAEALIQLEIQRQTLQYKLHHHSNSRISFVYRLLNSKDSELGTIKNQAKQLHYEISLRRCVILFASRGNQNSDSHPQDFTSEENRLLILQALSKASGFEANDIGDFSNLDFFSLIKYVPEESREKQHDYLQQFSDSVADFMLEACGMHLRICIGTCYDNLLMMRTSNHEAQFIFSNFHFFSNGKCVVFADDHIFDYLSSLMPEEYYNRKFSRLTNQLSATPSLSETLISLSKNDSRLLSCASELNLHRNTLLQRYGKIRDQLNLDPIASDRDRMTIRQYALFRNRKTVLHAGITIQGQSILHQIFRRYAALLEEMSNGTLSLSIHTIDISGNNASLFEVLRRGDIDMAVGNIDALCPLIGDDISILDLPFLFSSAEEAFSILQGELGNSLIAPIQDFGFIPLGYWSMGWRHFSSKNHPIHFPEDLKGKKVRIMQKKPIEDFIRFMGASPVHVSYDSVLAALQSGIIECQENPYRNFYDMQFSRHQDYILEMNVFFDCNIFLTTQAVRRKLSTSQWSLIQQAAEKISHWHCETFDLLTNECREKILQSGGVTIHPATSAELNIWKQACQNFSGQFVNCEVYRSIIKAKEAYHDQKRF